MDKRIYYTRTPEVNADDEAFQKLIASGATFRFVRQYDVEPTWKYRDTVVTIALTCRQEKRRNTHYFFAHWRLPGPGGKLAKGYLGKAPTLAKLNETTDMFYRKFVDFIQPAEL